MEEELINQIFKVKIRPELEAFGNNLSINEIENFINELPDKIFIAKKEYTLNKDLKSDLLAFTKKQFGYSSSEHIYIKGMGIYNDSEEIELDKENWNFYLRHKNYLRDTVFKENTQIVESLDYETDQIIKKFPKPEEHEFFNKKGLVIGYVQSGKTANFTHLISKAASIGYRFVVVLAGMTDTLRMQTQFRIDKELLGNNSLGIEGLTTIKWLPGEQKFISLTGLPNKRIKKDNGDFFIPVNNFTDHFEKTNDITIAIIKKLARNNGEKFSSIIGNLINWIESRYDTDLTKMPPVLIVDDEADQASIDSSDEESDPTVINHAIRKLISLFPKSVYVGYTATPFANVFINPANDYLSLEDLYPKDFIYALPEPDQYFGSTSFFGIKNKDNKLALVEYLENVEKNLINDEGQSITDNLISALNDFIYSTIIRRYRGNDKYCGIMIHTDHRNMHHNTVYSKVREYLFEIKCNSDSFKSFLNFITKSQSIGRLQGVVNTYPNYNYKDFENEFYAVVNYLKQLKNNKTTINIKVINSREDKLDYLNEELKYLICIGGNIMSRGVTIEGLTITYYLRDTLKYDTLLQMGRWFGYRNGYEDLLRIYTTQSIAEHFEFVMSVEGDLRNEVNRYTEEGLTPIDFAPKVRAHMRMHPTAKMGNSSLTKSYSQQSVQTIYFDRTFKVLEYNFNITKSLIQDYNKLFRQTASFNYKFLASELNIEVLLKFIKDYKYADYNSFNLSDIIKYLEHRIVNGEIKYFDLLLAGIKDPKENSIMTTIAGIQINPVKRNLRKSKGREYIDQNIVNVGVISDTADIKIAEENKRLTLIIYFIDKENSDAFNQNDYNYSAENINFNPIGFALVFPKTQIANGEIDYYQQIFE